LQELTGIDHTTRERGGTEVEIQCGPPLAVCQLLAFRWLPCWWLNRRTIVPRCLACLAVSGDMYLIMSPTVLMGSASASVLFQILPCRTCLRYVPSLLLLQRNMQSCLLLYEPWVLSLA
jgi:hypothetical protein